MGPSGGEMRRRRLLSQAKLPAQGHDGLAQVAGQEPRLADTGSHVVHHELEKKLRAFDIVADQYRQDLSLFWTRANFFLFVQSGLLAFLTTNASTAIERSPLRFVVCGVGLSIAVVWYAVSRSSIYWIGVWRQRIVEIDEDLNPYKSFSAESLTSTRRPMFVRLRPTIITTYLPIVFMIAWFVLGIEAARNEL